MRFTRPSQSSMALQWATLQGFFVKAKKETTLPSFEMLGSVPRLLNCISRLPSATGHPNSSGQPVEETGFEDPENQGTMPSCQVGGCKRPDCHQNKCISEDGRGPWPTCGKSKPLCALPTATAGSSLVAGVFGE